MKAIVIIMLGLFAVLGGVSAASACPGHHSKATYQPRGDSHSDNVREFWDQFAKDHG